MKYISTGILIWVLLLFVHTFYIWVVKLENATFNSLFLLFKLSIFFFSPFLIGIILFQLAIDKIKVIEQNLFVFSILGFFIFGIFYLGFELICKSPIRKEETIEFVFSFISGVIFYIINKLLIKNKL